MDKRKLPEDALSALESGRKIEAIKIVRMTFNVGLKEAKEIVEQYIEQDPELKKRINIAANNAASSAFKGLILIIAIVAAAYFFIK